MTSSPTASTKAASLLSALFTSSAIACALAAANCAPVHAEDARQFTEALVRQYDSLRANDPGLQEQNLQMVRDIMGAASQARKDLAIGDNTNYAMGGMMDRARGGLDMGVFGPINGEQGNPFMNAGPMSPGQLHEFGKSFSNSLRPCAPGLAGHVEPLFGCSSSSSYPSGHTAKATGAGLLAAYLFPERFQPFITRSQEYGESRIVAGQHYTLDVMASRAMSYKAVADLLAQQSGDPTSWLNTAANPARMRQDMLNRCGGQALQTCADGRADDFSNHDRNKAFYDYTKYYGFHPIGPTDKPMVVPENAEYLIKTRFPYLTNDQLREIIRTTADPSGQVLDDPWSRINLFAAADGYARLDADASVTMDTAKAVDQTSPGAGYNAFDIWRNDIGGAGRLTKGGDGSLVLTGDNSFGGFTLTDGMLTLTGANALSGSSNATGGHLVVDGGSLVTSGDLALSSKSTLSLDSASLAAGGRLDIAARTDLAGSASISVVAGRDGTVSGTVDGAGGIVKRGAGRLSLEGANGYSGGTRVDEGTLALGTSTAAGIGDIALADKTTLAYANGIDIANRLVLDGLVDLNVATGSATQSGAIGGIGNFAISGGGRLNITGDLSGFSGTTTVSGTTVVASGGYGGRVAVADNGVFVANGPTIAMVEVGRDGTLKGSGSVGTTMIGDGGTLAPGNSPGTLAVLGDLAVAHGSIYEVEVDPNGGASDLVTVSGVARIEGGSVRHVGLDGAYAPFSTYRILSADGGVQGRFEQVTSDYTFLNADLAYSATAVNLTLLRNDVTFASVAATPNQAAVAVALDGVGAAGVVYDQLVTLDQEGARDAFASLAGDIHSSVAASLMDQSGAVRTALSERLGFDRTSIGGITARAYGRDPNADPTDVAAADAVGWSYVFGNFSDRKGNDARLDADTGGMLGGFDVEVLPTTRLGVLGGYSHASYGAGERSGSANSASYQLGLYGAAELGGVSLSTGAAYAWHDIKSERPVSVGGPLAEGVSADYNAQTFQVFGEAAHSFSTPFATLEPYANLAYVRTHINGFSEQGSAAALSFDSQEVQTTFTTLGLRASQTITLGTAEVTVRGMAGWRHSFGDVDGALARHFATGPDFEIAGAPIAKDVALVTAGMDFQMTPTVKLGMSYNGQFGENTRVNGFDAKLSINF